MNEQFLYYIWQYHLRGKTLASIAGEKIEIIKPGYRNNDAGPDFTEAMVKVGTEVWAGNIEIHLKTTDWYKHHHESDQQYSSLILHVVYENDLPGREPTSCPTLALKPYIDTRLWQVYQGFLLSQDWIPCARGFNKVFPVVVYSMLERAMIERMERKVGDIQHLLNITRNNLHECFYIALARAFGQKTNAQAFEILARTTPIYILARYSHSIFQIEALLFGQSGLISEKHVDEYHDGLYEEYKFLKEKHHLVAALHIPWKFMRMHPQGFPTVRLAQFAALIHQSSGLLQKLLNSHDVQEMQKMLSCQASDYWKTHFRFGETSAPRAKSAGNDFINNIIINAVIPFKWIDARMRGNELGSEQAMRLLYQLPPENNAIIRGWAKLGYNASDAFASQSLLELKNRYCTLRRCLDCKIGHSLLKMHV